MTILAFSPSAFPFPALAPWPDAGSIPDRRAVMDNPEKAQSPEISLEALAAGDDAAWNVAFLPLYQAIWSVLRARVLPGLGVDLEERATTIITDEIMPGLKSRRTDSFRDLRDFRGLLNLARVIAARRSIDLIRKVIRRGEEALPEGWEDFVGAAEVKDGAEDLGEFLRLVNQLNPPKPELFTDHFVGEMTYEEIAAKHQMPLGTVCSHFSRGFKQLKKLLPGGEGN